jgi:hypothetical protein
MRLQRSVSAIGPAIALFLTTAFLLAGCVGSVSRTPPAVQNPPAAAPPAISVAVSPPTSSVQASATQSFTATLQNDSQNKGVNWTLSGSGCTGGACGVVSPASSLSGVAVIYTAPASVPAGAVSLAATSVADGTKSAAATITVTAPAIVVTLSPTTASVLAGGNPQTFTADLQNDSQNQGVNWTLSGATCTGATCGTISPASSTSGVPVTYTSPASVAAPATVTLTATSVASSAVTASAVITVSPPPAPSPSTPLILGTAGVANGYGIPVVSTDASGNVDVAWVNANGPEFVRSTDGGTTFSAPITIPNDLSKTLNAENDIQVGLDANGNISLLWRADLTGADTSLANFFSRSTDGGLTFSTPVNPITTPTPAQLVVQPSGTIVLAWFDEATSNLLAMHSTDGVTFSSPATVWTAVGNPMDLTTVVGSQGQIYLFWTQLITSQNCSILFSQSADAVTFSAAAGISGNSGSFNQTPAAFVDSTDNVNVAWHADGTSLFFSRSADSGATFSAPASVPTSPAPNSQKIAVGPDGTIYIVWEAQSPVLFSHSVDGGATFSSTPTTLGLVGGTGAPVLAVDSCNNISVVGQDSTIHIVYQRSIDAGVTFANPVTLSNTAFDYYPELALDKNGNVHVTYEVDGPPDIDYVRIPTTCSIH